MMRALVASLIVVLFVSACGNNKGGNGTPLTDSQKSQLKEVITASGRGPLAGMAAVPTRALSAIRSVINSSSPKADQTTVTMTQKLSDSIKSGQCSYTQTKGDPKLIDVSLTGNNCPIATHVMMKSWQSNDQHSFGLDIDLTYSAKDAEFAKLNDVTGFAINGTFKISVGSESAKGDGNMKSTIKSTKYGEVTADLNFDFNATREEQVTNYVAVYHMKDFTADLRVTETTKKNEHVYSYTVNGQEVTKEEFYSYTSSNPFLTPTVKNN